PDRHVQLLAALGMTHEASDRRVNRQHDVLGAGELAQPLRELVAHPEPALEVDLAGRQAALEQRRNGLLGALARRHPGRAEMPLARHRRTLVRRLPRFAWTSVHRQAVARFAATAADALG